MWETIEKVNKGSGIVIFPSSHEGRGIGIVDKIKAYSLQKDLNIDTFEANRRLGHDIDARCYNEINEILNYLNVKNIELLSENPAKIFELKDKIINNVPIVGESTVQNTKYLQDKKKHFSHDVEEVEEIEEDKKETPVIILNPLREDLSIAIVYSSWHAKYISRIRELFKVYLAKYNVKNIYEYEVPGSNEIPFMASKIASSVDGIICLGILIKGDTLHFENVSTAVSNGIMQAQIQTGVPMMNAILSCFNFEQVEERINGEKNTLEYIVQALLSII